jgi:hypothetical protein
MEWWKSWKVYLNGSKPSSDFSFSSLGIKSIWPSFHGTWELTGNDDDLGRKPSYDCDTLGTSWIFWNEVVSSSSSISISGGWLGSPGITGTPIIVLDLRLQIRALQLFYFKFFFIVRLTIKRYIHTCMV